MSEIWAIGYVVFWGALTQGISSFGFALVSMPLLLMILPIQSAVPLVSLVSIVCSGTLWIYHRHSFEFKTVARLALASWLMIPVGAIGLHYLPEAIALNGLGYFLVGYAIYGFTNFSLPRLKSPRWTWVFGSVSGILSGAYNTGGPPIVIYGMCCRWSPAVFQSHLPGLFLMNSLVAAIAHTLQGTLTLNTIFQALWTIPFFSLGMILGVRLTQGLSPILFRRVVLGLLLLSGLRLIF